MQKTITLVAHGHKKTIQLNGRWLMKEQWSKHNLVATGTAGGILQKAIDLDIHCFKSGSLGGVQQIGALIAEHKLDCLIFSGIH